MAISTRGQKAEAMALYSQAYSLFEARQDKLDMAATLVQIGDLSGGPSANADSQAKAADFYRRALTLIDPNKHRRLFIEITVRLGKTFFYRKDISQAKPLFEKALSFARELRIYSQEADIEYQLGAIDKEGRRYVEALAHF